MTISSRTRHPSHGTLILANNTRRSRCLHSLLNRSNLQYVQADCISDGPSVSIYDDVARALGGVSESSTTNNTMCAVSIGDSMGDHSYVIFAEQAVVRTSDCYGSTIGAVLQGFQTLNMIYLNRGTTTRSCNLFPSSLNTDNIPSHSPNSLPNKKNEILTTQL
jgi:hypothetical protein